LYNYLLKKLKISWYISYR